MTTPAPSSPRLDNQLELAKWIAIGTMLIDHVGAILFPELLILRFIGRIAFPLFCWIIAVRLAQKPARARRYLDSLMVWVVLSQPPFWLAFHGKDSFFHTINIMGTLGLGVFITHLWVQLEKKQTVGQWIGIAVALVLAGFCDYGVAGVAVIPFTFLVARESLFASSIMVGVFSAITNFFSVLYLIPWGDTFFLFVSCALLGGACAERCLRSETKMPRLPRWFFYAFYPVHIAALILLVLATP